MKIARLSSLVFVPLAFCNTIPGANSDINALADEAIVEHLKAQAGLLAVAAVGEELSTFFRNAQQVADDALFNYEGKEAIQGWPNSVEELVKLMDSQITEGRADITAMSSNPFQDLINGVGNAVNGVTGAIGGAINGATSAISGVAKNITSGISNSTRTNSTTVHTNSTNGNPFDFFGNLGGNGGKSNSTGANPLGDLFGGVTNGLENILNGGGKSNSTGANPIGDLLGGVTSGLGNLVGGITNSTSHGLSDLFTSITNTTGHVLDDLTSGIINPHLFNDTLSFLGSSVAGILDGKVDLGSFLKEGIDRVIDFTGATNPLGKFIQSLAQFLSTNQESPLATAIKVGSFINAVVNTVVNLAKTVVHNITEGIKKKIGEFVQGIISKIFFGGIFHLKRLQNMTADEAMDLQEHFLNAVRAQGSPAAISYTEALVDILNKIVQKLFKADPFILTVLTDPSEENIRRFVLTTAKVLTDHNA